MSTTIARTAQSLSSNVEDPFRLGWRYVKTELPDGTVDYEQVPLTEDDLLHPQEEDFIVTTGVHVADCVYLRTVFTQCLADQPGLVTLFDQRVDWGVTEPAPHGPDIAVFENVQGYDPKAGTFYVKQLRARPRVIIEVTSPTTRTNDLEKKLADYHMVRVPLYIIVDHDHSSGVRILAYEYQLDGYVPVPLADGRVWIDVVGLWLGVKDERVALYDGVTGAEKGDYTEVVRALAEQQALTTRQQARADAEQARADAQQARADQEQARAEAQCARAEELGAQLAAERLRAEQEARLRAEQDVELRQLRELLEQQGRHHPTRG